MTMEVTSVGLIASVFLAIGIAYVLWFLLWKWLPWRKNVKIVMKIPHGKIHWLLGSLLEFKKPDEEGLAWIRDRVAEFPRMGVVWYGPFVYSVMLYHPHTLKAVMKSSEPKPTAFGGYRFLLPWLGEGLLVANGKKWARNRRLITPAFHFDILKPYILIKNEAMDILLRKIHEFDEEHRSFDVQEQISLLTLDILLRCAFTYENDVQLRGTNHPYVEAIFELTTALTARLLTPWLHVDAIFYYLSASGRRFRRNCDYVHKVSSDIIMHRREALQQNLHEQKERNYLDFLDILLTAKDTDGQELSDSEIRDEADTFLFEGHDTTSSAISWTLYELAKHPDHLKKCQQEIDHILEGRQSDYILWEDLPKLSNLTMCIKESMRIHVPVPFIQRQLTEDVVVDGYTVPKHSVIDLFIYALHHNPTVWENTMEFRPSRFNAENVAKMDPYAFVPFSAGPRNCIGQNFAWHELKIAVARIIRKLDLELDPERPVKQNVSVVMKTESGLYLRAKPRQD